MTNEAYQYKFGSGVSLRDAIESLYLAIFASEGLHGRAQVLLDAGYFFDKAKRTIVIDGGTATGQSISQIFTALLARQFGEGAFKVEHVFGSPQAIGWRRP